MSRAALMMAGTIMAAAMVKACVSITLVAAAWSSVAASAVAADSPRLPSVILMVMSLRRSLHQRSMMRSVLRMSSRAVWCLLAVCGLTSGACHAGDRPNILWLVAEDTSASNLPCYGSTLARTPNLDALAARSIVFDRCFTNPVCAPSRFTLITGMHAASCGPAHHMRAQGRIPADLTGFPALLRSAGYYTTNNAKTDYNSPIDVKQIWNASGKAAHYRNRPEPHQPFFAVFNHEVTHESCLFPEDDPNLPVPPTDPATVRIPPYQPDTPEMRADWARQTDRIAWLDRQIQEKLDELDATGLANDTIVFFFGDNGGVTPRSKRFLQASGTQVPLLVHFPPKWRHLAPTDPGARLTDPVGFVDFSATVLAIAGVPPPPRMQGQPFAGPAPQTNEYVSCTRDRMDERYDMSRSVMDRRWLYIRHFRPDIPYVQPLDYQFRGRGYQSWARAAGDGSLTPATAQFWGRKPAEELYDLESDPDTMTNLAAEPAHREEVVRLRAALRRHTIEIHDNGLLPEGSPHEGYDQSRDPVAFPVEQVFDLAVLASEGDAGSLPAFVDALDDPSEPVRWWAAQGCTIVAAGRDAGGLPRATEAALERTLGDKSAAVRVAAAEALVAAGRGEPAFKVFEEVLRQGDRWPVLQAVNALDRLGERSRPSLPVLRDTLATAERNAIPENAPGGRADRYGRDLLAHLIAVLEGTEQPLAYPTSR